MTREPSLDIAIALGILVALVLVLPRLFTL